MKWETGKKLAFLLIQSAEEDIQEWINNKEKNYRNLENRAVAKKRLKRVLRLKKNCEKACRVV